MTRRRVLIDIEFTVDEDQFKLAQLTDDATGVSEVTDAGIRDVVTTQLIQTDWAGQGLAPLRSIVTTRSLTPEGGYEKVCVPGDLGIPSS